MSNAAARQDRSTPAKFLRRLTLATAWGEGIDGFDLGVLSVVLPLLTKDLHISSVMAGLLGASSLIGIFVGGPVAGYLTARFGRQLMFSIDIMCFVVLGLLQAVVANAWQLLVIRLLLGLAIGAEYAIGAAMLAECAPARGRGRRLSSLIVFWYAGYLASVVVAYVLIDGLGFHWRWVLATSAVPALITLVLRHGLPESPRWLLSKGRTTEARAIVDRHLGGEKYFTEEEFESEGAVKVGYRELFAPGLRGRTVFVCTFWACLVARYFAIFTFAPTVFSSLHLSDARAGTIAANGIAALGSLVGMLTVERMGRRRQLIGPFWIMAAALAVVGLWGGAPATVIVVAFALFSFLNAFAGNLTAVYPIEVFPTEVRTSGVGLASAFSRVGAAAGTFLLPVGIDTIGIGPCMLIGAGLCGLGAVVSQLMAPETTGLTLTRTSTAPALARPALAG